MVFGTFAQGKSIDQMNGYDWVVLNTEHKAGLVQGYYIACTMMVIMSYELSQPTMNEQQLKDLGDKLNERFLYDDSVGTMMDKLNAYYASPEKRKFSIYRTIPFLAGKEWWNRQTGKVDVPSAPTPGS